MGISLGGWIMSSNTPYSRASRIETWRLFVVYGIVFLALSALLARMVTLQVVGKQAWLDLAVQNFL
jgi:hypothetical protein